jgi:hypothetical protein
MAIATKGAPGVRAGCAMIIAGVIFVTYRIVRYGAASAPPPDDAPAAKLIAHYRASLEKQRDLLESAWRWYLGPLVPGILVLVAGIAFDAPFPRPAPILMRLAVFGAGIAWVLAVFVVIGWVNRRGARKLGEQMKALDTCDEPPLS